MDFIQKYTRAKTFKEKIMCYVAKILGGNIITPLGRIVLLPADYNKLAIITRNEDMIEKT